jgi:chorismate mutase/prephenate dehydratase
MGKSKKSSSSKAKPVAANGPTPSQQLKEIQRIDQQLAELCHQRAGLYRDLAGTASEMAETIDASHVTAQTPGPLPESALRAILREVESASKSLVTHHRVAYLGPLFSYSHLAAIERFGQSCELIPMSTIAAVFESVNGRQVDFGIVPIENSTDGRIVDTLEMFVRLPVRICGEVPVRIHHYLLAKCRQSEIEEVHSKPQALSQCRDWLAKHLPGARQVQTASTTAAAEEAVARKGVAAIASQQAGIHYGLNVVASQIEDNKDNATRFAVIGLEPARRTSNDKTSLMFELNHRPGALADAMLIFKRSRLNLTWIESFPKQGSANEYIFFVELEGHQTDVRVRRAIAALEKRTKCIEILGSYARNNGES